MWMSRVILAATYIGLWIDLGACCLCVIWLGTSFFQGLCCILNVRLDEKSQDDRGCVNKKSHLQFLISLMSSCILKTAQGIRLFQTRGSFCLQASYSQAGGACTWTVSGVLTSRAKGSLHLDCIKSFYIQPGWSRARGSLHLACLKCSSGRVRLHPLLSIALSDPKWPWLADPPDTVSCSKEDVCSVSRLLTLGGKDSLQCTS